MGPLNKSLKPYLPFDQKLTSIALECPRYVIRHNSLVQNIPINHYKPAVRYNKFEKKVKKTRNVSETSMPPIVQHSGLYSLQKQNLYEASIKPGD